jgi:hypothetical protein
VGRRSAFAGSRYLQSTAALDQTDTLRLSFVRQKSNNSFIHVSVKEEETLTLREVIDRAETFCLRVETVSQDVAPNKDEKELRGKLGLCRVQIAYLRNVDDLSIDNPQVRDGFRHLITALMWVAFYARDGIDFKLYRMLVMVESSFTYLTLRRIPKYRTNGNA